MDGVQVAVFILVVGVPLTVYVLAKHYWGRAECVCTRCHAVNVIGRKHRGSTAVELLLWMCCLLPGLVYSFWRGHSSARACPVCGSEDVVPVNTPRGAELLRHTGEERPQG